MVHLLPLLFAVLLFVGGQQLLVRGTYQSVAFVTLNLSFAFWYWLPAAQLLIAPSPEILYATQITVASIRSATWLVLLYHFVAVFAFLILKDLFDARPLQLTSPVPLTAIAVMTMISSLLCFFIGFRELGVGQQLAILTARQSAREVLTFYNRSEGAGDSLLSLWQIFNTSFAVLLLAALTARRTVASAAMVMAGAALGVNFLASGTRTLLLMGMVAVMIGWQLRSHGGLGRWQRAIQASRFRLIYLVLLAGVGSIAFYGVAARFALSSANTNYVADSVINNNDMMRELAFVIDNMSTYVAPDPSAERLTYTRTPFNTLMPSFLGFAKPLPYHLIVYNYSRAGIDLENEQGNVFPGIVGDFRLVFGGAGPLLLSVFVLVLLYVIQLLAVPITDGGLRAGVYAVNLVIVFASFRNIQGHLAMVLIGTTALIWLMQHLLTPSRLVSAASL